MPFPVKAVANYFLELAEADGKHLDPMKIQKLVYFAHGWHLALTGKPLVDEYPEAWQYGPVFPSLYHEFKQYGAGAITGRAYDSHIELESDAGGEPRFEFRAETPSLDDAADKGQREYAKAVLKKVWDVYSSWSAIQLSQLTHEPGGPWAVARDANPGRKGANISDELIERHFRAKAGRPS